MIESEKKVWN